MPPAFLGVVVGRIFLWVQLQDIRRKDDDNDRSGYNHSGDYWVEKIKKNDAMRGVTKDNPLTLFNKGDLENALDFYYRQSWNKGLVNTRRCDTVIVICVYRKYWL